MPLAATYLAFQSCYFYRWNTKPNALPGMQVDRHVKDKDFLPTIGFHHATKTDLSNLLLPLEIF